MQNSPLKYLTIFSVFCLAFVQPIYSQENKKNIFLADSLFNQKQYTQALTLYEKILEEEQQFSPSMLLKMAYIKEGLRDFTGVMYYLHLYYSKTPNRAVLRKMEDLAQTYRLSGYEYSDRQFFKTQLHKYYLDILEGMLLVAVSIITIIAFRRKIKSVSNKFKMGFSLYLIFIFYYINYLDFGQEGIIRQNRIPIMSAPSAGSFWLASATQGNKIRVTGEKDIWYEIEWKDKRAYIRKQNILLLP